MEHSITKPAKPVGLKDVGVYPLRIGTHPNVAIFGVPAQDDGSIAKAIKDGRMPEICLSPVPLCNMTEEELLEKAAKHRAKGYVPKHPSQPKGEGVERNYYLGAISPEEEKAAAAKDRADRKAARDERLCRAVEDRQAGMVLASRALRDAAQAARAAAKTAGPAKPAKVVKKTVEKAASKPKGKDSAKRGRK